MARRRPIRKGDYSRYRAPKKNFFKRQLDRVVSSLNVPSKPWIIGIALAGTVVGWQANNLWQSIENWNQNRDREEERAKFQDKAITELPDYSVCDGLEQVAQRNYSVAKRNEVFGTVKFGSGNYVTTDEVGPQIVPVDFMGYWINVHDKKLRDGKIHQYGGIHKKVYIPLKCVEREIINSCPKEDAEYEIVSTSTRRIRDSVPGPGTSKHPWGIAIDINAGTNPYCSKKQIARKKGRAKTCSKNRRDGKPYDLPPCWINAFKKYGWFWLGDNSAKDYMHFNWHGDPETLPDYTPGKRVKKLHDNSLSHIPSEDISLDRRVAFVEANDLTLDSYTSYSGE